MRLFIIIMLFLSSMAYANVSANISNNTPSDESVERLIKARMIKEHYINAFSEIIPQSVIVIQIFPFIISENDDKQALEQKLAMMLDLNKKSQEMLRKEIATNPNWVEFIDKMYIQTEIDQTKSLYNQEQVNALIEFYESPIGKSIALTESYKIKDELVDSPNIDSIIEYVENHGKDISINYDDTKEEHYRAELEKIYENSPTIRYMYSEMFKIAENPSDNSKSNP